MERQEVKDQERLFKELPLTLLLDIIMARRQHDNEKKEISGQHSSGELDNGNQDLQESRLRTIKNK